MTVLCSLTGVDAKTDLDRLAAIARTHPNVEFAILLSNARAGHDPRYPEFGVIEALARRSSMEGFRTALHLCGSAVTDFVEGKSTAAELAPSFGRVQLNFVMARVPFGPEELDEVIGRFGGRIITQHNHANETLWAAISSPNHDVLFDASGGRGIVPEDWPLPLSRKRCGYAGGISPGNVGRVLEDLDGVIGPGGWIDMESSLRDERDAFDLDRCESVLQAVQQRNCGIAV